MFYRSKFMFPAYFDVKHGKRINIKKNFMFPAYLQYINIKKLNWLIKQLMGNGKRNYSHQLFYTLNKLITSYNYMPRDCVTTESCSFKKAIGKCNCSRLLLLSRCTGWVLHPLPSIESRKGRESITQKFHAYRKLSITSITISHHPMWEYISNTLAWTIGFSTAIFHIWKAFLFHSISRFYKRGKKCTKPEFM